MLKVTRVKFNIRSNRLAGMKIKSDIIQQDLRISWKLSKIFMCITLKSPGLENQQYRKVEKKETENWEFFSVICLRDFAF